MNPADTVTWETTVETWRFPLDERQRLRLEDCTIKHCVPEDEDHVAIIAISPEHVKNPDLFLSRPLDVSDEIDLRFYIDGEPFHIRFGSMPADVFANLSEHDGW